MRDCRPAVTRQLVFAGAVIAAGTLPASAQTGPNAPGAVPSSPATNQRPSASTTAPPSQPAETGPNTPAAVPRSPSNVRPPASTTAAPPQPTQQQGFTLNDAGGNYRVGDFTWTFWGYGERIFNPGNSSPNYWRRFRQGSELDFPRITSTLRPAFVYEIDLVDSNFLANGIGNRRGFGRRNSENVFFAIQDADDPAKLRALVGENTAILSREDNLSSGNLPTVNRSLVLEEHNSTAIFGPQFGVEYGMALTPRVNIGIAALDNRGSFNVDRAYYTVGNSLSAKAEATLVDDAEHGRKLTFGAGVDDTRDFPARTFPLLTAIAQNQIGGVPVSGNKVSGEADAAFTFPALFAKPATIEAEGIYSHFSGTKTDIGGGYAMLQHQVFSAERYGDLDLFARYDFVSFRTAGVSGAAFQQAARLGANYNLPYSQRRLNFHLEYAHNRATGPVELAQFRGSDEFILELRFSLQPYIRH